MDVSQISIYHWIIVAIGVCIILVLLLRTCRFLFTQFFRQPYDLLKRYSSGVPGSSWAVITGSSGGIGRGFAVELARRGFNICLISRSMDRLEDAKKEVERVNPNIKVKLVVADFRLAHDHRHRQVPSYEDPNLLLSIGRKSNLVMETGKGHSNDCSKQTKTPHSSVRLANRDKEIEYQYEGRSAEEQKHEDIRCEEKEEVSPSSSSSFTSPSTSPFWTALLADLDDIKDKISILVNNVGINHTEPFTSIPEDFLFDIVAVNCTSQMMLTRKLINCMLKRRNDDRNNKGEVTCSSKSTSGDSMMKKSISPNGTRKGAIISISSVAGQRPLLYLSPYSATKAFNDFFSRSLSLEFGDELDILSLRAGYVASNMSKLTETGGFVLDRYECARGCLEKLGYVTETYGDPRHAVYARSFFLLPERLLSMRRKKRLEEKIKLTKQQHTTTTSAHHKKQE